MKVSLSRTILLRNFRKMRFEEANTGRQERRLTQREATQLLRMSKRNFRRYVGRYEADGLNGLIDLRIEPVPGYRRGMTVRRRQSIVSPRRRTMLSYFAESRSISALNSAGDSMSGCKPPAA